MDKPINKLTNLKFFHPLAEGIPGNRVFFIMAEGIEGNVKIQLEKEQLLQLSLIIQELLASNKEIKTTHLTEELTSKEKININTQLIRLEIKKDNLSELFLLNIYDTSSSKIPIIQICAYINEIKIFAENSIKVCASGRPICPLCGNPINSEEHICPRSNGHIKKDDLEFES